MIREIANENELENSVRVIADSFQTVAVEFNLTKDNCPTHPSFVTVKQLNEMKRKGLKLCGLFENDVQIGFCSGGKEKTQSLQPGKAGGTTGTQAQRVRRKIN